MFKNGMRPVHPGEILLEDYIKPMGVSVRAVAMALHVPYSRLSEITKGERGVSAQHVRVLVEQRHLVAAEHQLARHVSADAARAGDDPVVAACPPEHDPVRRGQGANVDRVIPTAAIHGDRVQA